MFVTDVRLVGKEYWSATRVMNGEKQQDLRTRDGAAGCLLDAHSVLYVFVASSQLRFRMRKYVQHMPRRANSTMDIRSRYHIYIYVVGQCAPHPVRRRACCKRATSSRRVVRRRDGGGGLLATKFVECGNRVLAQTLLHQFCLPQIFTRSFHTF